MTLPAIATPSDDPRFETLRDRPEISPWSASGKLDCTTLTDDVSIAPTPRPTTSRPGAKVRTFEVALAKARRSTTPAIVRTNPARMMTACGYRFASLAEPIDETRMPMVAGVRMRPVSIAL